MTVGIICALEEELGRLLEDTIQQRRRTIGRLTYIEATLGDADLVACVSGVGKVNAAICATTMATVFAVSRLINIGVAGGLSPTVEPGAVILSTDLVQYDVDCTALGEQAGQIPNLDTYAFEADNELLGIAEDVAHSSSEGIKVYSGRIISGDRFVSSRSDACDLYRTFGGLACEMEGAAVAQVAHLFALPVFVVRSISDDADEKANIDFELFKETAAEQNWTIAKALITCR